MLNHSREKRKNLEKEEEWMRRESMKNFKRDKKAFKTGVGLNRKLAKATKCGSYASKFTTAI